MSVVGETTDRIPTPLPLLARFHAPQRTVEYRNVYGDAVKPVHHIESGATTTFHARETRHHRFCVPTGTAQCPACLDKSSRTNGSAASVGSSSHALQPVSQTLSNQLPLPKHGSIAGAEPIWHQDLAYELQKLYERLENEPCGVCGEVLATTDVDEGFSGHMPGCMTWDGTRRYTVFASDYGKAEVNVVTTLSVEDYVAVCDAVKVPFESLVPFAKIPLPLPSDARQCAAYISKCFVAFVDDFPPEVCGTGTVWPAAAVSDAIAANSLCVSAFHPAVASALSDTLVFSSSFECGNLKRADRLFSRFCPHKEEDIGLFQSINDVRLEVDQEYDLWLREDLHTKGNIQWFYFSVRGASPGMTVRFNLVNHNKDDSLFNYGLLPAVYSQLDCERHQFGWRRLGTNACYYRSSAPRPQRKKKKPPSPRKYYFVATFTYTFPHAGDTVYFAYCQPYSASKLQAFLQELESDRRLNAFYRRRMLCETLAGNPCDVITVTAPTDDPEVLAGRPAVIVSARVHPGETNSSWMMQGFLRFITGDSLEAQLLRSRVVFKIIPMLNPDGVISGNYRCSLMGCDLNRRWDNANRFLYPTIHATKALMARITSQRNVLLFCDLHGHSRQFNIFVYGCAPEGCSAIDAARARLFPHLLFKESPAMLSSSSPSRTISSQKPLSRPSSAASGSYRGQALGTAGNRHKPRSSSGKDTATVVMEVQRGGRFSFGDCAFNVQESKRSTARIVAWEEFDIANSFTLEASFCGAGSNAVIDRRSKEMKARRRAGYSGRHDPPKEDTEFRSRFSPNFSCGSVTSRPTTAVSGKRPSAVSLITAAHNAIVSDGELIGNVSNSEPEEGDGSEDSDDCEGDGVIEIGGKVVSDTQGFIEPLETDAADADDDAFFTKSIDVPGQVDDDDDASSSAVLEASLGRQFDYDEADVDANAQRHFSTLDLELQGRSIGLCIIPMLPIPIVSAKSITGNKTVQNTEVKLKGPKKGGRAGSKAKQSGSATKRPSSAVARSPSAKRKAAMSAVDGAGADGMSPALPADDAITDMLADVMKDIDTFGLGRDDDSGSDSNPSDDNMDLAVLKGKPSFSRLMSAGGRTQAVSRHVKRSSRKHKSEDRPSSAKKSSKSRRKSGVMIGTAASRSREALAAAVDASAKGKQVSLGFGSSAIRSPHTFRRDLSSAPIPSPTNAKLLKFDDVRGAVTSTPTVSPYQSPPPSRPSSVAPIHNLSSAVASSQAGKASVARKSKTKKSEAATPLGSSTPRVSARFDDLIVDGAGLTPRLPKSKSLPGSALAALAASSNAQLSPQVSATDGVSFALDAIDFSIPPPASIPKPPAIRLGILQHSPGGELHLNELPKLTSSLADMLAIHSRSDVGNSPIPRPRLTSFGSESLGDAKPPVAVPYRPDRSQMDATTSPDSAERLRLPSVSASPLPGSKSSVDLRLSGRDGDVSIKRSVSGGTQSYLARFASRGSVEDGTSDGLDEELNSGGLRLKGSPLSALPSRFRLTGRHSSTESPSIS